MGPQTNLEKALKTNRKPVSFADATSQRHDMAYSLAKNEKDIRDADVHMIKQNAKNLSIFHPLESLNSLVGMAGIGSKIGLESIGLASKDTFTKTGSNMSK